MAPATKEIEVMDLGELLAYSGDRLRHASGGGIEERLRNAISVRIAGSQDRGAQALVRATGRLVTATGQLGRATWVLGAATVLLVGVTAAPIVYSMAHREDVGERIRRECEAILREAGDLSPLSESALRNGVAKCLIESATRGRN